MAPVCLPRTKEQLQTFNIGEMLTVAGWGKMNMTTEDRADVLQVVAVSIDTTLYQLVLRVKIGLSESDAQYIDRQ